MKRFILPNPPEPGGLIRLSGKDYHYLVRVRRFGVGSFFKALLPEGEEVRVRVRSIGDKCLIGQCISFPEKNGTIADPAGEESQMIFAKAFVSPPSIALFQALPKTTKMDMIVRQAAEGGVTEIFPFISDHSVPKIQSGQESEKTERWVRIIKEARQQSGSDVATLVRSPGTMDNLLGYWETLKNRYPRALGILLHQVPLERGGFHCCLNPVPEFTALAVGPEGGFSPREVSQFIAAGFKPLVLGNTVLRTETAAVYAVAAIRIILLESSLWIRKLP